MEHRIMNRKGIRLHLVENGPKGPIILWPMYPRTDDEIPHMMECLAESLPGQDYFLAAIEVGDWNRDLSPWQAPPAFGNESFAGEGAVLKEILIGDILPLLEEKCGKDRKKILIGYSLAGLFALWMAYESDAFDGIVSASGSLWFDEWDHYVADHRIAGPCSIYLSLGGKEEKTRNRRMALVGDRTRAQEQLLQADPMVKKVMLEWNSGGHFADAQKRLVKGIQYLLTDR